MLIYHWFCISCWCLAKKTVLFLSTNYKLQQTIRQEEVNIRTTNIEKTMQPSHPNCALTFLLLFSCRPMKFFSMSHGNLHSRICKQKIVPRTIGNRTSVPHLFQCFWWQKYQFWFPRRSTTVAVHNLDRNCGWWILMGFRNAKHQQHNLTYPKIKDRTSCECL